MLATSSAPDLSRCDLPSVSGVEKACTLLPTTTQLNTVTRSRSSGDLAKSAVISSADAKSKRAAGSIIVRPERTSGDESGRPATFPRKTEGSFLTQLLSGNAVEDDGRSAFTALLQPSSGYILPKQLEKAREILKKVLEEVSKEIRKQEDAKKRELKSRVEPKKNAASESVEKNEIVQRIKKTLAELSSGKRELTETTTDLHELHKISKVNCLTKCRNEFKHCDRIHELLKALLTLDASKDLTTKKLFRDDSVGILVLFDLVRSEINAIFRSKMIPAIATETLIRLFNGNPEALAVEENKRMALTSFFRALGSLCLERKSKKSPFLCELLHDLFSVIRLHEEYRSVASQFLCTNFILRVISPQLTETSMKLKESKKTYFRIIGEQMLCIAKEVLRTASEFSDSKEVPRADLAIPLKMISDFLLYSPGPLLAQPFASILKFE